ncbi:beta strand repeat-containing protein [Haloferula sp.]|uniref:beta strand repeat-containing protein n=1 Tax=Haloferula sp. TaxID=2497595 RepID=UPI00329B26D0
MKKTTSYTGAIFAFAGILSPLYGDSATWNGNTNALWSELSNWEGPPAAVPGSADVATFSFGLPTNTVIDLGVGLTVRGLVFNSPNSTTLGTGGPNGQSLTRASGDNFFANAAADHLIDASIILGDVAEPTTSFVFQNQGTTNLLTLAGDISTNGNPQNFNKQGLGSLVISGDNSYGNTAIENGEVILGSDTALGTGDTVTVRSSNSPAAGVDSDVTLDIAGNMITVTKFELGNTNTATFGPGQTPMVIDSDGSGLVNFTGAVAITYNAGNVGNLNGTATVASDVSWNSNKTFNVGDGGSDVDFELSGSIVDIPGNTNNALFVGGAGRKLFSSADNSDLNLLGVRGGILAITSDGALGTNRVQLGFNATTTTLDYVGVGETIDNQIEIGRSSVTEVTFTGGAVLLANGSGPVTFSAGSLNFINNQEATLTRNLQLGGSNMENNTVSGIIRNNNAGAISLTKEDAGTWILNGANTYTGDTSINAGRLDFNGVNTGTGATTVADGASIGGEGTIAGALTIGASTGANLHIDGGTSTALTVDGALDTSAGVTVFVDGGGGGVITVLNYNGLAANVIDVADFTLDPGAVVGGRGAGPFVDTGSSITIDLGFVEKTWISDINDNWDEGPAGTANWSLGGGDNLYYDGDVVTFDDSASFFSPMLATNVSPGGVVFSNDTQAYTLSDIGGGETLTIENDIIIDGMANVTINAAIAGTGLLTKGDNNDGVANGGNLLLTGPNTYSGGTNLTEGQLQILDSNSLGTGPVNITDDGANSNTEPSLELDANLLVVANDITMSNDGFNKRVRFDIVGTGNTAELIGTFTTLETLDRIRSISVGTGEILTISGQVTGAGGITRSTGAGVLVLNNDTNDFASFLQVRSNAVVEVTSITDSGLPSAVGTNSVISLGYNNENGTLRYAGAGDSTNRQVRIGEEFGGTSTTGGAIIENNGTGALVFTNAAFNEPETDNGVGLRALTLGGSNADANEVQGTIADNNDTVIDQAVSVIKNGVGTWCLSGTNTYSGDTTVDEGTLSIKNASAIPAGGEVYINLAGGGDLNLDFVGTATIGALYIDGEPVADGTYGSATDGISGTGMLNVDSSGGGSLPSIIAIELDGSGNVILTLDGSEAGLTVQQSQLLTDAFVDVASTSPGANQLQVDAADVDPNADGKDFYRVRD